MTYLRKEVVCTYDLQPFVRNFMWTEVVRRQMKPKITEKKSANLEVGGSIANRKNH